MPPLTNDRHERFCHKILADPEGKAGPAYERSGFKARGASAAASGRRLLQNVTIQARIAELKDARSERTGVTLDDVVEGLLTEARRTGNPAGARVQAWGLLGKHVGAFEADNSQKAPLPIAIVRVNAPPDDDA